MSSFEDQVQRLVDLGYPDLVSRSDVSFRTWLAPVRELPVPSESKVDPADHVPFVLVVPVPVADAAERMTKDGRTPILMLDRDELDRFAPTVSVPDGPYLLVDVDTGTEFCAVRPQDALPVIAGRDRTGLTIAEGVAVVTQFPQLLRPNKCFSLLASRCGDKRVPAIWLSKKSPKLGWCWDGNPHTWLGSASAGARIAP